jgi:hypothetical protein
MVLELDPAFALTRSGAGISLPLDNAMNCAGVDACQFGNLWHRQPKAVGLSHDLGLQIRQFSLTGLAPVIARAVRHFMRLVFGRSDPSQVGKRAIVLLPVEMGADPTFGARPNERFQNEAVNRTRPAGSVSVKRNAQILPAQVWRDNFAASFAQNTAGIRDLIKILKFRDCFPVFHRWTLEQQMLHSKGESAATRLATSRINRGYCNRRQRVLRKGRCEVEWKYGGG